MELLIYATSRYEPMSFMDDSGYNQIKMHPNDEEMTAFRSPKGLFCYQGILFGLKNVGTP